jgi:NADH-quinone oxidoreductase subunit C
MNATIPLAQCLQERFGAQIQSCAGHLGETTIEVAPADLLMLARALRDEDAFCFEVLIDVCGVDHLGYGHSEWENSGQVTGTGYSRGVEGTSGPGRFDWDGRPREVDSPRRFAAVLHLLSLRHNRRLRVRVFCPDQGLPVVPSVTALWPAANWFEREAFDLYGIVFEGHPDLRRLLTDYGFVGHAFRKDFPLIGNVEVRYDPEQRRVIYQPVSIEPRVLVPRVVRDDERYAQGAAETADHWRQN